MVTVFLSLGSNAGTRNRNMADMLLHLAPVIIPPVKRSRRMETEPLEVIDEQEWYLNCVVSGLYGGTAWDLLEECLAIEQKLGRRRAYRHCPRTADIDILLFGDVVIREKRLCIPHPGLLRRRYCLEGVKEIKPGLILPGEGTSVSAYYNALDESIKRQKINFIDKDGHQQQ
jgi:2-amino-4-hydroxy-6-hydroxymethyldihydropteridine diphosphokinase